MNMKIKKYLKPPPSFFRPRQNAMISGRLRYDPSCVLMWFVRSLSIFLGPSPPNPSISVGGSCDQAASNEEASQPRNRYIAMRETWWNHPIFPTMNSMLGKSRYDPQLAEILKFNVKQNAWWKMLEPIEDGANGEWIKNGQAKSESCQ